MYININLDYVHYTKRSTFKKVGDEILLGSLKGNQGQNFNCKIMI